MPPGLSLSRCHRNGKKSMDKKTVNDKKKYEGQPITRMLTIWANSAEVVEDNLSQLSNRFFKANVDESIDQSKRVERFQQRGMAYGDLSGSSSLSSWRRELWMSSWRKILS